MELVRCQATKAMILKDTVVRVAALIPGVKVELFISPEAKAAGWDKANIANFHASEGNCNTCRHLTRITHQKDPAGFLFGKCESTVSVGPIVFHPDDPMHMACHEPRTK